MPDFSSNIAYLVRFDLTNPNSPNLVLTDTSTALPTGVSGRFNVTYPSGAIRFGDPLSPDTVSGVTTVLTMPLAHATALAWQLGNYSITYTLSATGYTDTVLTKAFVFNFAGLAVALEEQFDLKTPLLKYADATNYTVAGFAIPLVARSWTANSLATGAIASASSAIDLGYGGMYYSSTYSIGLTITASYASAAYSYLSVYYVASASTTAQTATMPPPLSLMLQWLTAFRLKLDNTNNVDVPTLYGYAAGMYAEIKSTICNGGSAPELIAKLYSATHRGAIFSSTVPTNLPLTAYDYTACGIVTITNNTTGTSSGLKSIYVTATAGQTTFLLPTAPVGAIAMTRNGNEVWPPYTAFSGVNVNYAGPVLNAGDQMTIYY